MIQGEQLHRDSLGNESVVKDGDVQWTTAGRGVIHSEGPTREFVKRGGKLEGIQLWLNLPASKKMIPAKYQHVKNEAFRTLKSDDNLVEVQVIAGALGELYGRIQTETSVNAYMIHMKEDASISLPIQSKHRSILYLINGEVQVNSEISLEQDKHQLIAFNQDGEGFNLKSKQKSQLLFLSGEPFNEKVVSWGPYVMNSQTEIMEALRDYQDGKMGFLPR